MSSTIRKTAVDRPANSRLELCAIASKHRLHVGRRAGDHLQDLGGRGLPLERLLGLVEQAHVLDRDHRLVGEGLQQRDLLVGKRPGLGRATGMAPMAWPRVSSGTARMLR